ncbi:MAG: hypothetical protein AB7V42_06305 [Thermoleophilia bacterium]
MIIRILGLGQFRLDADDLPTVEKADDAVEAALASGDEAALRVAISDLIDVIVQTASPVPDQELVSSDVVVPPADTDLDYLRLLADGDDGLIPG